MTRFFFSVLLLLSFATASARAAEPAAAGAAAPAAKPPAQAAQVAKPPKNPYPQPNLRDMTQKWGVRVEALRMTANGAMLDFRYRVTDEKKAAPLFSKEARPYLLHEKTGAQMFIPAPPKVGTLRNTDPPHKDRVYFMLFANVGKRVKQGDKVTVVIGDFKADKLKVE